MIDTMSGHFEQKNMITKVTMITPVAKTVIPFELAMHTIQRSGYGFNLTRTTLTHW